MKAASGTAPDSDPQVPPQPAHGHLVHGIHVGGRLRAQPGAADVRWQKNPPLHRDHLLKFYTSNRVLIDQPTNWLGDRLIG